MQESYLPAEKKCAIKNAVYLAFSTAAVKPTNHNKLLIENLMKRRTVMKKRFMLLVVVFMVVSYAGICFTEQVEWKKGGPDFIYVKAKKKSPIHPVYDEELKCIECHQYDGIDGYTSATMTLKKSKKGRMPREEIKKAIFEALQGNGNNREMYVLSTSFNNNPLATAIEFTLDPKTFTFIAGSEKQTEKLFQVAANENVSLLYVKHRDDHEYFTDPLGVQIVGKAKLLTASDPEFEELMKIYLPTLPTLQTEEGKKMMDDPDLMKRFAANAIATKLTPERIVIFNGKFSEKGYHNKQIWEAEKE
jgi:hypothetical protein